MSPSGASIGRLEHAAIGAGKGAILNETLLLLPKRRIENVRVARIEAHVVGAGVLVFVEDLLETRPAIGGTENASLRIRAVRMSQHGDKQAVRIFGIYFNIRDHLRIAQAEMRPCFARVGRSVHSIACRQVGPNDARAAAHVDDIRIRWRNRNRANGTSRLAVKQRLPGRTIVRGTPHAAIVKADVEQIRLIGYSGQRPRTSGAWRSDWTPMHLGIQFRIDGLCEGC